MNNSACDGYSHGRLRQYLLIYCQLLIIHPQVARCHQGATQTLILHWLRKGYLHAKRGETVNAKSYQMSDTINLELHIYRVDVICGIFLSEPGIPGYIYNHCKKRQLLATFTSVIWRPNLQPLQVAPPCIQNWN